MQSIYYIPPSGSALGVINVVYGDTTVISSPSNTITYYGATLEITASAYETSGSVYNSTVGDLRAYIKSGSLILASYPTEDTNIYYGVTPDIQFVLPFPQPAYDSSSFNVNWSFTPNQTLTSSSDVFAIYSGSSNLVNSSVYSGLGLTTLNNYTTYSIIVSGSGFYYTSSLSITNNATNTLATYITASNSYIAFNFSSSVANTHTIAASTATLPGLVLTYNTSSNFPTASTNVDDWNVILGTTASILTISGNDVTLAGGSLGSQLSIDINDTDITYFSSYGLTGLVSCSLNDHSRSFPNIVSSPYLSYLSLKGNYITGSIPSLLAYPYLTSLVCASHQLSGSIPNLSSSFDLRYFDCFGNYLTGGIDLTRNYNLQHFDCNSNQLSSSIGSLDDCFSLQYFDCSYNHLTGSIPSLNNCYSLEYFDCNNNKLITYTSASGEVSYLSPSLLYFDASNNLLTTGSVNGIVKDLYYAGGISGTLDLSGTGNAPCTSTTLKNNLINIRGWTVTTN